MMMMMMMREGEEEEEDEDEDEEEENEKAEEEEEEAPDEVCEGKSITAPFANRTLGLAMHVIFAVVDGDDGDSASDRVLDGSLMDITLGLIVVVVVVHVVMMDDETSTESEIEWQPEGEGAGIEWECETEQGVMAEWGEGVRVQGELGAFATVTVLRPRLTLEMEAEGWEGLRGEGEEVACSGEDRARGGHDEEEWEA